jgi:DNA-binding transcriptional MerR regulator
MKTYTIGQAARELGVSAQTLRSWDVTGRFFARRRPSGRRFYTQLDLSVLLEGDFRADNGKRE